MTATLGIDQQQLADICRAHDVTFLGIFGSTVHSETRPDSDIDLLVRFAKRKSLLFVLALQETLEQSFCKPVDLVTEASSSLYLRDRILQTVQVLYAA